MAILLAVALLFGFAFALGLVFAVPFMIAWGIVAPVFGLPTLSLIESWALIFITGAMFKSTSVSAKSS